MSESFSLTPAETAQLLDEMSEQWEYHLLVRSIFTWKLGDHVASGNRKFVSPPWYRIRGAAFKYEIPDPPAAIMARRLSGVGAWLNQNYVIRLFGLLDGKGIIKAGINRGEKSILLLKILRNEVGAHSSGKRPKPDRAKKAAHLIKELYGHPTTVGEVRTYSLSVDNVLEPLMLGCRGFVQSLTDPA